MKIILISFIKVYSFLISPLLGQNCRFYPSCSTYTAKAIETHGSIKGTWLGLKRIMKCHPYYKGAFDDPVPEAITGIRTEIKQAEKSSRCEDCTSSTDKL